MEFVAFSVTVIIITTVNNLWSLMGILLMSQHV